MGGDQSLIGIKKPKNLEHIQTLFNYDQKTTLLEKAKKWVTRRNHTRPHSISEWCQILGSTKTNPDTRSFLEQLVEEDALFLEDEDQYGTKLYKLDKAKLEEAVFNDCYWDWNRSLSIRLINNQEPSKTVTTDI